MFKQKNNANQTPSFTITCQAIVIENIIQPEDVFSAFSDLPWAIWLDSCNSKHTDSRYDIMVWEPSITITTLGDLSTITNCSTHQVIESYNDPLTLVKNAIEDTFNHAVLPSQDIPFKGGAVGCFSYDLGRRFETLPNLCIQDIDIPEMSVGIYTKAIIYDNTLNSFFLVCRETERENIERNINENIERAKTALNKSNLPFNLTSTWQSNLSQDEYETKFNQVHDYLLSGDCYQINLAQRFTASYHGDEFESYKLLRKKNNAPFSAFIRLENATVMSVSPERFLSLKADKVQSKPIKGTKPRNIDIVKDDAAKAALLNSIKDKAENLMIVDLLRNDISKVCIPGTVKVPKLFDIESFPAVHHLVSTVVGTIKSEYHATDLLRGSFPGGSITGAPKIRAMQIIEELEPHRRSAYCGSIGYISACGNMDTSITIRTLICHKNNIHCWAGGGLVADSDVHSEYQETFDKVNKILPVLSENFYHINTK